MNPLNEYFNQIVLINLARRRDRLDECTAQFTKYGIENVTLFNAHDMPGWGNNGCTASHRGVLELISHHKWARTLVLEDDFQILHDDFNERFASMIGDVPSNWEMIYLGAHYAEKPQARISPRVIRSGRLKTTSSYAVTYELAREMAPHIAGIGPIDELYGQWNQRGNCYVFQPRLMVQRESYSDLQQRVCNNSGCMMDTNHENMV